MPDSPDPAPPPPPRPAGALLDIYQVQELADRVAEVNDLAAGYGLRFRIRPELETKPGAELRSRLNEQLAEIADDLKVE